MDTIARVRELSAQRGLSLYKLSQLCDVPYSTLKNTEIRGGQLTVDSIERICRGLHISLSFFFREPEASTGGEDAEQSTNLYSH